MVPARPLEWAAPVEPDSLYSGPFKSALDALGIAPTRWHDLHHTFAVLNLSAGVHYMMVSKRLGHATYVTTLPVYADSIPETEGGKSVALARPSAPAPVKSCGNVVQFRTREA